jgi:tetratricopeptide (TPR) repeat protein
MKGKPTMRALVAGATLAAGLVWAQDWMQAGIRAFGAGEYVQGVDAFERAIPMKPADFRPRLYLAVTCMTVWMKDREGNRQYADRAEEEFWHVLEMNPGNKAALLWGASLELQLGRLDQAESWYLKAGSEGAYGVGVIAWRRWYEKWVEARRDPTSKASAALRVAGPMKDAMWNLQMLSRRDTPDGVNAAAYASLYYMERSELSANSREMWDDLRDAERALGFDEERKAAALEVREKLAKTPMLIPPVLPAVVVEER